MKWFKNLFKTEIHNHNHYHINPVAVQFQDSILYFGDASYGGQERIIRIRGDFVRDDIIIERMR